jgi:hypothetical protein
MLFDFRLRRVQDIAPWHDAGGANPHLHWYALTDGWYSMAVGDTALFRYSEAALQQGERDHGREQWWVQMAGLPYVDYEVARLWQDVLWMLTDLLEPVPHWLARTLGPDGAWTEWQRQAELAAQEALPDDEALTLISDATDWLGSRILDSLYLVAGPRIWIWSDEQDVHIWWDNRELFIEGVPAWEAMLGDYTLSRQAYLDEMRAFDARFLGRMRDRVAMAQANWNRPEVALDPRLAEDQRENEQWSKTRFETSGPREPTDWDVVQRAIARIEALPRFTSGTAARLT